MTASSVAPWTTTAFIPRYPPAIPLRAAFFLR
jgi:hypothetical protein